MKHPKYDFEIPENQEMFDIIRMQNETISAFMIGRETRLQRDAFTSKHESTAWLAGFNLQSFADSLPKPQLPCP